MVYLYPPRLTTTPIGFDLVSVLPTSIVDEAVLQLYTTPTDIKLLILPVIRYELNFDICDMFVSCLAGIGEVILACRDFRNG